MRGTATAKSIAAADEWLRSSSGLETAVVDSLELVAIAEKALQGTVTTV